MSCYAERPINIIGKTPELSRNREHRPTLKTISAEECKEICADQKRTVVSRRLGTGH